MGFRSLFNSKKQSSDNNNQIHEAEQMGRAQLIIEIAAILSNQNENVISDMTVLAQSCELFYTRHKEWCDEVIIEEPKNVESFTRLVLAYWLAGYDRELQFGAYIDWKEETKEILFGLKKAIENLHYSLNVDQIKFSGDEFTDEALKKSMFTYRKKAIPLLRWIQTATHIIFFLQSWMLTQGLRRLGKR